MLAERVKEWTREWKQEGVREGIQEGIKEGIQEGIKEAREQVRAALVDLLEKRFGPLPQVALERIESLEIKAMVELSASASTAPSLAALGLG